MNINTVEYSAERFIVDDAGTLIDLETRECYDIVEELVDLLNQQESEKNEYSRKILQLTRDYNNLKHRVRKLAESI